MTAAVVARSRWRAVAALAVGAVAAVALCCAWWLLGDGGAGPPCVGDGVRRPGEAAGPNAAARPMADAVERAPAQPDVGGAAGTLTIALVDAEGHAIDGAVQHATALRQAAAVRSWDLAAGALPLLARNASAGIGAPAALAGRMEGWRCTAAGKLELVVPRGHWTWLCAVGGAARSVRCVHVPPFAGAAEATVVLDGARRGVHVFVYDGSLVGMAGSTAVELLAYSLQTRGTVGDALASGVTEQSGYLFLAAPRDGVFLTRLGGAGGAGNPEGQCLVALNPASGGETVVVLALPEARFCCRFHLRPSAGEPLAWLLCRAELGRECAVPAALQQRDEGDVELLLPRGRFLPRVMPAGNVAIAGGRGDIEVTAGGANEWTLSCEPGPAHEVQLAGLPRDAWPVVVRQVVDEDLMAAAESHDWVGPARWHRTREAVVLRPEPGRLVVESRRGVWTSATVAAVPPAEVALLPACLVEVHDEWRGQPGLVAEFAFAGGCAVRLLRPAMVGSATGRRPLLRAAVVVPAGAMVVQVRTCDGELAWERSIEAAGPRQVVTP